MAEWMKRHPLVEGLVRGRFSILLLAVALTFFVLPLLPGRPVVLDRVFSGMLLVVVLACLRAISLHRRFFWFMVGLSLLNLALSGANLTESGAAIRPLGVMMLLSRLIYYVLVFFSIMRYVLDPSPVTGDKICGALSGYILMGLIWAVAYSLFFYLDTSAFLIPERIESGGTIGMWSLYFSFTTLTTLGYGDITPAAQAAQSYAIMEAACGQVFLSVLIARLVALQITERSGRRAEEE